MLVICGNCLEEFNNKIPIEHECKLINILKRQENQITVETNGENTKDLITLEIKSEQND